MKLAKYWAKGEIDRMNINPATGNKERFFCWGWSNDSLADAAENGRQHALRAAAQLDRGEKPDRYTYGDKALREKILEKWESPEGSAWAALTINSYGCDIFNTTRAMFVDVDISDPQNRASEESAALKLLENVLGTEEDRGAHIYRTAGGLRYIITGPALAPGDPAASDLMKRLNADPLYITLCRVQECFRARLTPKPWRCHVQPFGLKYPWDGTRYEAYANSWRDKYAKLSAPYAVCKYLGYQGAPTQATDDLSRVLELHDRVTKAKSGLPLA